MRGGTFIRLLVLISLMGIFSGILLLYVFEELLLIDEIRDQKRAEMIVEQAAKWYIINNGEPSRTMYTDEVKEVLIPHYLNKWPGTKPIECVITPEGEVLVSTVGEHKREVWFKHVFVLWIGEP